MIRTNIRIGKYSNIFEYPNIRHTLAWTTSLVTLNTISGLRFTKLTIYHLKKSSEEPQYGEKHIQDQNCEQCNKELVQLRSLKEPFAWCTAVHW